MTECNTRCGRIAIVGRPNAGKSTLINALLEEPVSIATHKAQTTRHCILGIKTKELCQFIYIDTPGIHVHAKQYLQRQMNKIAHQTLSTVDAVIWLTDRCQWTSDDERVAECLGALKCPIVWCMNKIDRLNKHDDLMPHITDIRTRYPWIDSCVPISARHGNQLDVLESILMDHCPQTAHTFPEDMLTDRQPAFTASETIRAQVFKQTHQEVPYATHVTIDAFKTQPHRTDIQATLWVERPAHKMILVGRKGQTIKRIGIGARETLNRLLDTTVHLKLWVKIQKNWSDDPTAIAEQDLSGPSS